ncbi:MAG: hypothetical protein U0935_00050 [Pirellulales bacterium]
MDWILKLLTEILFRLKELPGLSFIDPYYQRVRNTHMQIKKKIKKYETNRDNIRAKVKQAREIPSLVKGSKKKT